MKKVKVNAYAKINLILDVTGVEGKFHTLKSLVCSIDLADKITLIKREDGQINLKEKGIITDCDFRDNNAYRAAQMFVKQYKTNGVDIILDKRIPLGGGLGGSSADIAGVLKGLKRLYGTQGDVGEIADKLGSDARFMLNGGYALMEGRGDKITSLNVTKQFYLLILSHSQQVTAKECYEEYDKQNKTYPIACDKAIALLRHGEYKAFLSNLKNDLYSASVKICPRIEFNLYDLKEVGSAVMTGSGSAVVGVYLTKKQRDYAYKHLKKIHGDRLIKAKTITNIN